MSSTDDHPLAIVTPALRATMERRGFTELTAVQRAVLAAESAGRDLRISSQTGSGKTVAIGLALASDLLSEGGPTRPGARGPVVLVLVPTRELAMQVRDELRWLFEGPRRMGIEVVIGGTSVGVERRALSRAPEIVVGTPGRALDHLRSGALRGDGVAHVVLDESDRMLDLGFREDLEAILEALPAERRTHLVSATFPGAVRKLADRYQSDALHIEGTRLGVANADIEHIVHVVDRRAHYAAIVNLLLMNEGSRCLVFVERRVDVARLTERLTADGFPVQALSGELAQAQRTRTIGAFRDGTIKTLVATDVAARGIDVPDIELVIHGDIAETPDTYVHRSGRTGRAGRTGRSISVIEPRSQRNLSRLLSVARIEADWRPAPSASRVRKRLRKSFRRQVHAQMAECAEKLGQKEVDYAKDLLEGRDPVLVVAALLALAEPAPPRQPMEVGDPSAATRGRPADAPQGYVTFEINWGEENGAAANRLLGHLCRRGQIRGDLVGAIEIGARKSRFDVDASVASRFEKLVRKPDPRDPALKIHRVGRSDRCLRTTHNRFA